MEEQYRKKRFVVAAGLTVGTLFLAFQNCGKTGFGTPKAITFSSISSTTTSVTLIPTGPTELLNDPLFQNGFRAHNEYCERYSEPPMGPSIPLGDCMEYKVIPGVQLQTIPDPLGQPNDSGKFWGFQEGESSGLICDDPAFWTNLPTSPPFTPETINGETRLRFGPHLHERLSTQTTQVTNSVSNLIATNQTSKGPTHYFSTDKKGRIRLGLKTANLSRNVARNHSPCYRYETWPHYYVQQYFKRPVEISPYSEVELRFNVNLRRNVLVQQLPEYFNYGMFGFNFLLRKKSDPFYPIWIGSTLYQLPQLPGWNKDNIGVDQWGIANVTISPTKLGGPLQIGTETTIRLNVKQTLQKILPLVQKEFAQHSLNPDDYVIMGFGIGWEIIGDWDLEADISAISLKGLPK